MLRALMTAGLLAGPMAGSAEAAGMKLDDTGLVNIESPAVVGLWGWRFEFTHVWNNGEVLLNERVPVAELGLTLGVHRRVQLRLTGLYNNSDVAIGADTATKRFAEHEGEVQVQLLDQRDGAPLSVAVAATAAKWNFHTAVNANAASLDGSVYGGKLLLHRDFERLGQYVAYKWAKTEQVQTKRSYVVSAVGIGERVKLWRSKKTHVDLVAEVNPILDHTKDSGRPPKAVWAGGLQFKFYNPHTITFFYANNSSATLADSVFGEEDMRVRGFRWSYRF